MIVLLAELASLAAVPSHEHVGQGSVAVGRTMLVTLALDNAPKVPRLQRTVPPLNVQPPWEATADTKVALEGRTFVMTTALAASGRVLVTAIL